MFRRVDITGVPGYPRVYTSKYLTVNKTLECCYASIIKQCILILISHIDNGSPLVLVSVDDVLHLRLQLVSDAQLVVNDDILKVLDACNTSWHSTAYNSI